jgi:peptide/nickel transport system substrate-binding protein
MTNSSITDEDLSGPVIDRRTALKLFGAGAMTSMAGCLGDSQQTASGGENGGNRSGGKLVAGWKVGEISNLDPVLNSTPGNEHASWNIFDSLLRTTPDLQIKAEAAKDWSVKNAKQYVFTLREGMQFQKGYGAVTAKDVKYSIKRGLNTPGSTVEPQLNYLKPIEKGGVVVKDKYTVELNLKEPFVPFLKVLTQGGGACAIQSKSAIEELGKDYQVKPVGSGPFEVKHHDVGSSLLLKGFDEYWATDDQGNQLPYLNEVNIKPIPSASTLINAIRSGDIQFVNIVPFQKVGVAESASGVNVMDTTAGGWEGLYFNLAKEPWKDNLKLRRGVAKVLDRKQYIEDAFLGNQMPAFGPISPIHRTFWRKQKKKSDTQKLAQKTGERLIEESGAMGSKVNIMVWKAGVRRGRALSQQLSKYFDVTVNVYGTSTYLKRLASKPGSAYYDITPWGSSPHVAQDTELYNFFKSPDKGGVFNRTGYSNDQVDTWLNQERVTTDTKKRKELFYKIEDQVIRDVPVVFLNHYILWQAATDSIRGYTKHPIHRDFTPVWLHE